MKEIDENIHSELKNRYLEFEEFDFENPLDNFWGEMNDDLFTQNSQLIILARVEMEKK